MRLLYVNLLYIFIWTVGYSNSSYPISAIDQSLRQNAREVIRESQTKITIRDVKNILTESREVRSILSNNGESYPFTIYFDKNIKISNLRLIIYDANGELVQEYKSKDFNEVSVSSNTDLILDGKYKLLEYVPTLDQFTYEFSYNSKSSNTAFIEDWYIVDKYGLSVEQSSFDIQVQDKSIELRVDENLKGHSIRKEESLSHYTASIKQLPAFIYEDFCPSLFDQTPLVNFSLSKFSLEGVEGYATNWEQFGLWYFDELIKSQKQLSPELKLKAKELTSNCSNNKEKASVIYDFVQSNSRYVSIQLGIGGWKPETANSVSEKGYGDCKGLTNLTMALLESIGIESNYAVVHAGSRIKNFNEDQVGFQGNHVILNLPNIDGQEYWLECTSQQAPFGHIGSFTDDRTVLSIGKNNSVIKKTNSFTHKENSKLVEWDVEIHPNAVTNFNILTTNKGEYFSREGIRHLEKHEITKIYKSIFQSIESAEIASYDFSIEEADQAFIEQLDMTGKNFGFISESEFYIPAIPVSLHLDTPKRYRKRKTAFIIERNKQFTDKVKYELPNSISIATLPDNIVIENEFGKYELIISGHNNMIQIVRSIKLNKGKYPKEVYSIFRNFIRKINTKDQEKITLQFK